METAKIVFNSSPLIHLAQIERLDLLKKLYTHIIIPSAVHQEVVIEGTSKPGSMEIAALVDKNFILVKAVQNQDLVTSLRLQLDFGESEAIALALEIEADLIVLDESEARSIAQIYELNITGIIGILLKAYKLGLLEDIKSHLDNLIEKGFWIHPRLYQKIMDSI